VKLDIRKAFDFTSQFVLVTDGSSGIGLAIAQQFVEGGTWLVLVDCDDRVHGVAAELGGQHLPLVADGLMLLTTFTRFSPEARSALVHVRTMY